MEKKQKPQESPKIPQEYSKREHFAILAVLLTVIIFGSAYLFLSNGSSEEYRAPNADAFAAEAEDFDVEDDADEPEQLLQGLPETQARQATEETPAEADPAPAEKLFEEPAAEAPQEAVAEDEEPVVRKVTTKKIDEEIKTVPQPEPEPTVVE